MRGGQNDGIPARRVAAHYRAALSFVMIVAPVFFKLSAALRKSLTWDPGKELASHSRAFPVIQGIYLFFRVRLLPRMARDLLKHVRCQQLVAMCREVLGRRE